MLRSALTSVSRPLVSQVVCFFFSNAQELPSDTSTATGNLAFSGVCNGRWQSMTLHCIHWVLYLTTHITAALHQVWRNLHRSSSPCHVLTNFSFRSVGNSHSRRWYWGRNYRLGQGNLWACQRSHWVGTVWRLRNVFFWWGSLQASYG